MQVIRIVALRLSQSWGAAVAVVVTSFLMIPRASEAACGDYLHVSGRSPAIAHSMRDHLTNADRASDDFSDHGAPRRPCRGPGCSNAPLQSPAPVPTVIVSMERWALASSDTLPVVTSRDHTLAESVDLIVDGFRLSIFRPPR